MSRKDKIILPVRPELLDEMLKDYRKLEDLLGNNGLLQQLTKALIERALQDEWTRHLVYEKYPSSDDNSGNYHHRLLQWF